jgi:uncharacterized ParB-like nuclease family protein
MGVNREKTAGGRESYGVFGPAGCYRFDTVARAGRTGVHCADSFSVPKPTDANAPQLTVSIWVHCH